MYNCSVQMLVERWCSGSGYILRKKSSLRPFPTENFTSQKCSEYLCMTLNRLSLRLFLSLFVTVGNLSRCPLVPSPYVLCEYLRPRNNHSTYSAFHPVHFVTIFNPLCVSARGSLILFNEPSRAFSPDIGRKSFTYY